MELPRFWWTVSLLDLKGGHHAEDTGVYPELAYAEDKVSRGVQPRRLYRRPGGGDRLDRRRFGDRFWRDIRPVRRTPHGPPYLGGAAGRRRDVRGQGGPGRLPHAGTGTTPISRSGQTTWRSGSANSAPDPGRISGSSGAESSSGASFVSVWWTRSRWPARPATLGSMTTWRSWGKGWKSGPPR